LGELPSPTSIRGTKAEQTARAYLEQHGYRILAWNYRCRRGEIDIIAEDGMVLCFVEVRSRRSGAFGGPLATVDRGKQLRIIRAVKHYLAEKDCADREIRFDVVGITYEPSPQLELIRGAFEASSAW
jgi:putative endonuclease